MEGWKLFQQSKVHENIHYLVKHKNMNISAICVTKLCKHLVVTGIMSIFIKSANLSAASATESSSTSVESTKLQFA